MFCMSIIDLLVKLKGQSRMTHFSELQHLHKGCFIAYNLKYIYKSFNILVTELIFIFIYIKQHNS